MAMTSGNAIGTALLEALGIDPAQVEKVVLTCAGGQLATLDVTFVYPDMAEPADRTVPMNSGYVVMETLGRDIKRFELVDRAAESERDAGIA